MSEFESLNQNRVWILTACHMRGLRFGFVCFRLSPLRFLTFGRIISCELRLEYGGNLFPFVESATTAHCIGLDAESVDHGIVRHLYFRRLPGLLKVLMAQLTRTERLSNFVVRCLLLLVI
jgi:hypothetical protein